MNKAALDYSIQKDHDRMISNRMQLGGKESQDSLLREYTQIEFPTY